MGLLKLLFGNQTVEDFIPDFTLPEYDNWLNFLEKGGTDKEWKRLKVKKDWKFRKSRSEIFIEYQKELKPVSDKYYAELKQLESDWSAIYNSKKYDVEHSRTFEIDCKKHSII